MAAKDVLRTVAKINNVDDLTINSLLKLISSKKSLKENLTDEVTSLLKRNSILKKQKYAKSHRRNSTPWDSKDNLSCTEIFIKENYNNQYRDSHKRLKDTNEAEFLNDIKVNNCHWCLSTNIVNLLVKGIGVNAECKMLNAELWYAFQA